MTEAELTVSNEMTTQESKTHKFIKKRKRINVVHCQKEPFDIYVGRPSKYIDPDTPGSDGFFGNPFAIELDEFGNEIPGSREQVIELHKEWLLSDKLIFKDNKSNKEVRERLVELKGKVLGCWCHPLPCHGDTLSELANNIFTKQDIDNWWIEEQRALSSSSRS